MVRIYPKRRGGAAVNNEYIVVLDSGVGGLTVAKEIMRQLPNESILYMGDTKHCPYGDRTEEEIRRYTMEMVAFALRHPVKAIVVACNTATVVVLEELEKRCSVPVIGVVDPGVHAALCASKTKRIAVLATSRTIQSQHHKNKIVAKEERACVFEYACPWLVPLVEKGVGIEAELEQALQTHLEQARTKEVDTVILGCTHYPMVKESIQHHFGENVSVIDPAWETVRRLAERLEKGASGPARHQYWVSGDAGMFKAIAGKWLQHTVDVFEASFSDGCGGEGLERVMEIRTPPHRIEQREEFQYHKGGSAVCYEKG